jgi:hypothetical protein
MQIMISVAKGQKFWPQITIGANKNCVGPETPGPNFCLICQEIAKKGPNFVFRFVFHKTR